MEKLEALTLLQVGEDASPAEIQEAYRKRVREVRKRFDTAKERKDKRAQDECEREFEALKKALTLLKELQEVPVVLPPVPPVPPPAMELRPGTIFADRFELRRELGRGGMAVVWLAGDRRLERDVALKFLPDSIAHDRVAADDLRIETRQSIELSHPHIGRVYDFVEAEGRVAISMEYINGQTLSELRLQKPNQIFETRELEAWVKELCGALEYAHNRAMLTHCDINPSNLMVNTGGHLQITDFGIAKRIPDSMIRLDPARGTSGALTYMSPQQALGDKPGVTDDVYSLGATLFELLTSKPPFYRGEIWVQLKEKVPPSMAERRAELAIEGEPIPKSWEETVAACLAKNPSQRPQSALAVVERMERASFPLIVPAPIEPVSPPVEPVVAPVEPGGSEAQISLRRNLWLAIAGVILILACIFAAVRFVPRKEPVPTVTPTPTPTVTPTPATPTVTPTPSGYPGERYPQTRERHLTEAEVARLDSAELQYAINEMVARHGYNFEGHKDARKPFDHFDWYKPIGGTEDEIKAKFFSDVENDNFKLLADLRDKKAPKQK